MNKPVKILRRALFLLGCLVASQLSANLALAAAPAVATAPMPALQIMEEVESNNGDSTADHSKFDELKKKFKNGQEVTAACLSCHTEAAKQVHNTKHWTWEFLNPATKQMLGKKNVINNFLYICGNESDLLFRLSCRLWLGGRYV